MLVCGMISGCTDLEMIIEFSEERINFLKKYTELDNIPCLSTLSNILKVVNPDHLELYLYGIFNNVFEIKMKIAIFHPVDNFCFCIVYIFSVKANVA